MDFKINTGFQNTVNGIQNSGNSIRNTESLQKGEKSFADTLKDAIGNVNQLQKTADVQMQKLATGKAESIPDVMIAAEQADIALKLMVQVRNKIIDAYHEIMKMQV
jgi:flagellar hook-basal body complex protein FliE